MLSLPCPHYLMLPCELLGLLAPESMATPSDVMSFVPVPLLSSRHWS